MTDSLLGPGLDYEVAHVAWLRSITVFGYALVDIAHPECMDINEMYAGVSRSLIVDRR